MNYKNIARYGATALLVLNAFAPVMVVAQEGSDGGRMEVAQEARAVAQDERAQDRAAKACERIAALADKMSSRLENASEMRAEHAEKKEERSLEREARISENRERWKERRENLFSRLDELVAERGDGTEGLVNAFKQAVNDAVAERQATIDSANEVYHVGLAVLLDGRATAVADAKTAHKDGTLSALNQAVADCNDGADPATVRDALKASLAVARDAFKEARQGIDTFKDAKDAFKSTLEAARDELKQEFGDAEESEDDDEEDDEDES